MQTQSPGAVMAPVSPAVARLFHKLQAEIIKQADTGLRVLHVERIEEVAA